MKIRYTLGSLVAGLVLGGCTQTQVPANIPEAEPPRQNTIVYPPDVKRPSLSDRELTLISNKIYGNEASYRPENLMVWHNDENFASLGIGHFIWYPKGEVQRFDQTFPSFIDYMRAHNIQVPAWLISARSTGAPWPNKQVFDRSKNHPEFLELKRLLSNTKKLQTKFFFDRVHQSIPQIVKQIPQGQRQHVVNNYNTLANTPGGWYPLIDYINFKGKGIKVTERYNGQGWGLLQALQEMRPVARGPQALQEFSRATQAVLERRVRNSPAQNNEARWLPGWRNRTATYRRTLI